MPAQPNSHGPQAQHLRRESSQSAHSDQNRGFPPNGGRGRGFQPQSHYNPNVGNHSPQPYRPMPNQPMGRGMPPAFQPQGAMQHNSPYRQNRSPAITPATMHQQQHLANPQGMPYYQGQPYPQPNMYGMPPQGLDPYNNYYGQQYGLQQSIHYPGVPASPGRGHGFPQQMQNPYSMPGPYGQPPQGQSMSRTPSQMSERPPSAVPQPTTPAMTNVNHISHTHTPSVTSASPAPSSSAFERPKKKSAAIVIKNADGEVVDFKTKAGSPAPNAAPAAPAQSRSPAIVATPTPPPRAPSASDATKTEEAPAKSASEKKADFVKQFQEKLRLQEEADKKAKDDADSEAKAAADAEQKKKDDAKAAEEKAAQEAKDKAAQEAKDKADQEAKEKEEAAAKAAAEAKEKEAAEAASKAEDDEAEKKRKEDEEFERMVAEMEAEDKKREEDEKRFAEEKKRKKAEEDAKAGDKVKAAEEAMRKAEREAEAAEIARENETPEQKAEREAKDKELFASLKKNTMFGPGATGDEPSEDAAPPSSTPAPAAKPLSATKPKPAALKLETNKPVEPAQPTAGMESLKTARFLQIRNEAVNYPEGIQSPNPALNQGSKSKGRQYDKDFLLQFQEVFKEKPSVDWDLKLKETVGDGSDSARPQSARPGNSMGGRAPSGRAALGGGMGNFGQGGAFGASRTLPPGTTSKERFDLASGRGGTMTNPLAPFVQGGSQRGFPMGPPGMSRSSSFQPGPNSPRVGSQGGRGDRSRRGGGGKGHQGGDVKTMPLTAGKEIKELEKSTTGWKPHGSEKQQVVGHMAPDMVQRKVKAALNKMTPEKFDKISDQILEIAAQSKDETDGRTLRQVIQLTFEKACDESHWSSMYAKFCNRMLQTMSTDIKDERVLDKAGNPVVGGALFRKYLLNRCQEEFERGWEVNLPDAPEEGKEATMLSDEYYIAAAAKRKGLGLIQFIGELYKLGMLTLRIMHECVLKLLDFEGLPDESAIESLVKLLRTVGATMESAEAGPKMINMYFERVEKVMHMEGLPSRLQFMLLDTIDLRKSGWKSKDILKGPKTIAEIHQEAVAAQQAAEMERSRSQRGGGGGRMPMGRGDARSFSGGGMMPPQDTGGRVQMDDLRKLSKGASARGLNNAGSLGPSMLGSRSGSGRRGLGPGMMGRGGDESGNSSRTGTPPVQKEKSTVHANAFDALAALEAEDNAGDVSSPPQAAAETESKPSE
jgi:translation initiation factor 4G